MGLDSIFGRLKHKSKTETPYKPYVMPELFCPNCNADLDKQKGYSEKLNYWTCKSCGEVLVNPEAEDFYFDSNILWICDGCGGCLNEQPGFSDRRLSWECTKCKHVNSLKSEDIYDSNDLYDADMQNPMKGMSDSDLLELSCYRELRYLDDNGKVSLVQDPQTGKKYVRKILSNFDSKAIKALKEYPAYGMPGIEAIFSAENFLISIEEYLEGETLENILLRGQLSKAQALSITVRLCDILSDLHGRTPAIIHRDIKPANIIMCEGEAFLIDIDAAKEYNSGSRRDTVLLGTKEYAAPEQYGFASSDVRTDIFALGVLLNYMLTGKYPGERLADGVCGEIVQRCTRLDPENRFKSADEIKDILLGVE